MLCDYPLHDHVRFKTQERSPGYYDASSHLDDQAAPRNLKPPQSLSRLAPPLDDALQNTLHT